MYRKQKTYTLPVEDREVIVPFELLPDYADVCFDVMGEETKGLPHELGKLVAYSDNDEETVTIKYDKQEEKDDVTPIVEAIRDIPIPEIPKTDLAPVTEALKNIEDAVYATEAEFDTAPIVKAVNALRKALDSKEIPEPIDFTDEIRAIAERIPQGVDLTEIADLLVRIAEKETPVFDIPERFVSDNRIKVEVDRIGGGSGSFTTERVEAILKTGTAIKAADSFSIDAFGRWRVSEPYNIFDSKQLYDSQPLYWDDQQTSGGGTGSAHSVDEAATTISVSADTVGTRVRQTFMRFNYSPGKSQLILCTFGEIDTATGITKRVGYFDDKNGLYLESAEGVYNLCQRSYVTGSAVDTKVAQANWNIDKFDGTGPSGVTLDWTKTQILYIDFEWLGVGRVRMGFVVDGKVYYAHAFNNANNLATVYMSTPNLPIRYEISNDGNGAADDFVHICSTVVSEGGQQKNGALQHEDSTKVTYTSAGTRYIAMAGRLKTTHTSLSIDIENVSCSIFDVNKYGHWEFVAGGTVTGDLTFNDKTNSGFQIAIGNGTQTLAGGQVIDGRWMRGSSSDSFEIDNALRPGSAIDGTPQTWYLVFVPDTNNTAFAASVTWRELL